jgi:soluble lytic murein transglycosylase-like protein
MLASSMVRSLVHDLPTVLADLNPEDGPKASPLKLRKVSSTLMMVVLGTALAVAAREFYKMFFETDLEDQGEERAPTPEEAAGAPERDESLPQPSSVSDVTMELAKARTPAGSVSVAIPTTTVSNIIVSAARSVGVDPGMMLSIASAESSFDPNAGAGTSSARGLFQFTKGTWANMVAKYSHNRDSPAYGIRIQDIEDARSSAIMGALYAKENVDILKKVPGAPITPTSVYMAHFLGPGDVRVFFNGLNNNPNAPAATSLAKAAGSNADVFYKDPKNGRKMPRTFAEIWDIYSGRVGDKAVAYNQLLQNQGLAQLSTDKKVDKHPELTMRSVALTKPDTPKSTTAVVKPVAPSTPSAAPSNKVASRITLPPPVTVADDQPSTTSVPQSSQTPAAPSTPTVFKDTQGRLVKIG